MNRPGIAGLGNKRPDTSQHPGPPDGFGNGRGTTTRHETASGGHPAAAPLGGTVGVVTRADVHRLLDELPEASLDPVAQLLTRAKDPFLARLDAAPDDDEPVTAEDLAAFADASAGAPLEQVERELLG